MVQGRVGLLVAAAAALLCMPAARGNAQVGSIAPEPQSAAWYVDEGARHLQAREDAQAAEAYRRALELEPNSAAAYVGLGSAYYRMGRLPASLTALDAALRIEPTRATARLNRAITLHALARNDEALADIAEARRLASGDSSLLNEIAVTLLNDFGRADTALAVYREAAQAAPGAAAIQHNIGLLFIRLGRYADAIEPFRAALRIDPAFRNAQYFLAEAQSRIGDYEASTAAWTKFLALVPDGPDATENRAWDYLCWGGHGESAAADARHWLEVAGWNQTSSPYMALVAHFGSRQAHADADARTALDEAAARLASRAWPYPIVRYLRGELTATALLNLADSNDKRTEAHAYVGLDLLLRGDAAAARAHLAWVTANGNPRLREYTLASRAQKM